MRGQHRVLITSLVIIALVGAAACKRRDTGTTTTPVAKSPTVARYLNMHNLFEPEYIDPGVGEGRYESNIMRSLYEGLVQHDPKDLHAIPALAERWDLSPDKTTYTFHLRNNAVWTDGKPVTAHDLVYAWERVLNPKTGAKYAFAMFHIKNARAYHRGELTDPAQLGFRALDDHTFEMRLEHPTPFILDLMCYPVFFPVPRWAIEAHGARWTQPEHIVSNGPFALERWVSHKVLTLQRSPSYWDAANVKLAGIHFYPVEDMETALKMYEAGELDIAWELPPNKEPQLLSHPHFQGGPQLATYYFTINITQPPVDNLKVRQALAHAIDRKALVDKYLFKINIAHASMVPAGLAGYTPAAGLEFDPVKARALLAEAGYADPKTLPPLTLHYNTENRHRLVAQVLQQMWKTNLGIEVQLWNEEWKSYLKTRQALQYQISRSGWVGDYPDPNSFLDLFASDSPQNQTGWKSPVYDALLQRAAGEVDVAKRATTLQQAEALLLTEAPVIPVYTYMNTMLVHPRVQGFYSNLLDVHPYRGVTISE